jgi:hypothetical protein
MRYSLDEFRRILVDENTFIESIEPIIPKEERLQLIVFCN